MLAWWKGKWTSRRAAADIVWFMMSNDWIVGNSIVIHATGPMWHQPAMKRQLEMNPVAVAAAVRVKEESPHYN
jgi:hypothetical protein